MGANGHSTGATSCSPGDMGSALDDKWQWRANVADSGSTTATPIDPRDASAIAAQVMARSIDVNMRPSGSVLP